MAPRNSGGADTQYWPLNLLDAGAITRRRIMPRPMGRSHDNPLIIKPVRGHELVHDPVVGRPAHPAGFRWIGVVSRIASQSPAEFTRPTKRPVMNGLSLRGVGQAVGAAGPEVAPAQRQVQHPDAPVCPWASKPPPNPT